MPRLAQCRDYGLRNDVVIGSCRWPFDLHSGTVEEKAMLGLGKVLSSSLRRKLSMGFLVWLLLTAGLLLIYKPPTRCADEAVWQNSRLPGWRKYSLRSLKNGRSAMMREGVTTLCLLLNSRGKCFRKNQIDLVANAGTRVPLHHPCLAQTIGIFCCKSDSLPWRKSLRIDECYWPQTLELTSSNHILIALGCINCQRSVMIYLHKAGSQSGESIQICRLSFAKGSEWASMPPPPKIHWYLLLKFHSMAITESVALEGWIYKPFSISLQIELSRLPNNLFRSTCQPLPSAPPKSLWSSCSVLLTPVLLSGKLIVYRASLWSWASGSPCRGRWWCSCFSHERYDADACCLKGISAVDAELASVQITAPSSFGGLL